MNLNYYYDFADVLVTMLQIITDYFGLRQSKW